MAVGGGAADVGEEGVGLAENERKLLEGELAEAECTLVGELQQIDKLAEENNRKVIRVCGAIIVLYQYVHIIRARCESAVSYSYSSCCAAVGGISPCYELRSAPC